MALSPPRLEDPRHSDLGLLFARHHDHCHADTPPESIHMQDRHGLAAAGVRFFVLRRDAMPVAMGAWKPIAPDLAEIKSMHVLHEQRGQGLAGVILRALVADARAAGMARISLETGSQASFAAARALYLAHGFAQTEPFGPYRADPNSVFMSRDLRVASARAHAASRGCA